MTVVLRFCSVSGVLQGPAAAEDTRGEGEQAGSAEEVEDEAEGRNEPEVKHKQLQPAAKEHELSDEELVSNLERQHMACWAGVSDALHKIEACWVNGLGGKDGGDMEHSGALEDSCGGLQSRGWLVWLAVR